MVNHKWYMTVRVQATDGDKAKLNFEYDSMAECLKNMAKMHFKCHRHADECGVAKYKISIRYATAASMFQHEGQAEIH